MSGELEACRKCGADCCIESFGGGVHAEPVDLWMCSNSTVFGGVCDERGYFNAEAWNARTAAQEPSEEMIEAVAEALWRAEWAEGHVPGSSWASLCAEDEPIADAFRALARAAILAMQAARTPCVDIEEVREVFRLFVEANIVEAPAGHEYCRLSIKWSTYHKVRALLERLTATGDVGK